ncbi:MAG: alpha/beta fold hydrolase [Desulfobacteraceae bacterium]|nr:alpha/beta fold hydrolase [Desulfobacteraceae bacterium]
MPAQPIDISVYALESTLKRTIRHAAATRDAGESLWVKAERNGIVGYGEGCPRSYVAGDSLGSSIAWVKNNFSTQQIKFNGMEDVEQWGNENSAEIDKYPSAWCAVEMALLDIFAQEQGCMIEELLGIKNYKLRGYYTAVLGDDKTWKYTDLVDKYLIRGFTDFKIKLNGRLERDKQKLEILDSLCTQHNVKDIRIRLDANNLWKGQCKEAIKHIKALGGQIFALEEPVGARDIIDISSACIETGLPIILDESLCTLNDLQQYENVHGNFIANIKVSRVGGLIRALRIIKILKNMGWSIIIGCHVGETSLLTRAGMVVASAAGENLIAHEGAFGDYLVEREPVEPMLKFSRFGALDLTIPYYYVNVHGLNLVSAENWNIGFGMKCRTPLVPDDGSPKIDFLRMKDNYKIHYRRWGKDKGDDAIMILHGGMSHSGWQAPLAQKLCSISSETSVIAVDRRGCGLNKNRGDLGTLQLLIDDIIQHVEFLKKSFKRVHLAGWCQGAQFVSVAAARLSEELSSLILLTPGFFWNERFRSVLRISEKIILEMISEFNIKPERNHACIPVPMEATDFTFIEDWIDYIENDDLKTTMLTLKSVSLMDEIQELSWTETLKINLPLLSVIAKNDRIVDNSKVEQLIKLLSNRGKANRIVSFESGHAIQFEKADETARAIIDFIENIKG